MYRLLSVCKSHRIGNEGLVTSASNTQPVSHWESKGFCHHIVKKIKYNRAMEVNFTSRSYHNRRTRGRTTTPPYTCSLCYHSSPCLCSRGT